MSVTNEKDKQNYALSGNTAGVKQGDRMTLQGKASGPGNALGFEVQKVSKDFGACPPYGLSRHSRSSIKARNSQAQVRPL